jgi:hypothetical protein
VFERSPTRCPFVQVLPFYENRYLFFGLEVLSDRRKVAAAFFVRKILCGRIKSAYLTDLLRFFAAFWE